MARRRAKRKTLKSYTIERINETIRAGDCVLMRPPDAQMPLWVSKVMKITSDISERWVKVRIRWYYRPEDTHLGRRSFHGSKEIFLSDHYDNQSVNTIVGKCNVHRLKKYTKLETADDDDFFCRFEYSPSAKQIVTKRTRVYCVCYLPHNPDQLMVDCEGCDDMFHPSCIDMTQNEAKQVAHFFCQNCLVKERRILYAQSVSEGEGQGGQVQEGDGQAQ